MQQLPTDYKPDGALGGLFAGFNAADAENFNQLELIKNYLANQREVQMQPLDVRIKDAEASRADIQKTPEMLDAYKRGYMGQMNSQDAAGQKAMQTWKGEAELSNAQNKNKLTTEGLLARLNELKQRGEAGSFDFKSSQPSVGVTPGGGFNWQVSPEVQLQRDLEAYKLRKDEADKNPNDAAAQKDAANMKASIDARLKNGVAPSTENVLSMFASPQRNTGITPSSNPEYESIMAQLVDTPELRSKLITGDQKQSGEDYRALLKMQQAMKLAQLKDKIKDPKTAEEVIARLMQKVAGGEELSEAENAAWVAADQVLRNKAPVAQQGSVINPAIVPPNKNGVQPLLPKTDPRTPVAPPGGTTGRGAPPKRLSPAERQALIDKINKGT